MDKVSVQTITQAVKDITLTGLGLLAQHNIKAASMILDGIQLASEMLLHNEALKSILKLLQPVFSIARGWLEKEHPYFLTIFDWAKTIADVLFGSKQIA